jgi:hypothetical protein
MHSRDKIWSLFYPILKPANLPDFFAVARTQKATKDTKTDRIGFRHDLG